MEEQPNVYLPWFTLSGDEAGKLPIMFYACVFNVECCKMKRKEICFLDISGVRRKNVECFMIGFTQSITEPVTCSFFK